MLERGSESFSIKDPRVDMLGSADHTICFNGSIMLL